MLHSKTPQIRLTKGQVRTALALYPQGFWRKWLPARTSFSPAMQLFQAFLGPGDSKEETLLNPEEIGYLVDTMTKAKILAAASLPSLVPIDALQSRISTASGLSYDQFTERLAWLKENNLSITAYLHVLCIPNAWELQKFLSNHTDWPPREIVGLLNRNQMPDFALLLAKYKRRYTPEDYVGAIPINYVEHPTFAFLLKDPRDVDGSSSSGTLVAATPAISDAREAKTPEVKRVEVEVEVKTNIKVLTKLTSELGISVAAPDRTRKAIANLAHRPDFLMRCLELKHERYSTDLVQILFDAAVTSTQAALEPVIRAALPMNASWRNEARIMTDYLNPGTDFCLAEDHKVAAADAKEPDKKEVTSLGQENLVYAKVLFKRYVAQIHQRVNASISQEAFLTMYEDQYKDIFTHAHYAPRIIGLVHAMMALEMTTSCTPANRQLLLQSAQPNLVAVILFALHKQGVTLKGPSNRLKAICDFANETFVKNFLKLYQINHMSCATFDGLMAQHTRLSSVTPSYYSCSSVTMPIPTDSSSVDGGSSSLGASAVAASSPCAAALQLPI
ncbi:hypothetical protein BH10PSE19_BH10PSE19_02000 [soil metagenome]